MATTGAEAAAATRTASVDSEKGAMAARDSVVEDTVMPAMPWRTQFKIDMRVVPILCLLYALSVADRSNLAIARVAGLDGALGLSVGNRYSVVVRHAVASELIDSRSQYFQPTCSRKSCVACDGEIGLIAKPANFLFQRLGARPPYWLGGASIALCVGAWLSALTKKAASSRFAWPGSRSS